MTKTLLLFIHGLGGDKTTWNDFPKLITQDEELLNLVDIAFYTYPTSLFRLPFASKSLNIQTLAAGLKTQLQIRFGEYKRVVLVCHSLGGLIARRYLIDLIKTQEEQVCSHLLLFSVPNTGAGLGDIAKLISWRNNQLRQLCKNSDFLSDLNEDWFNLGANTLVKTTYVIAGQDRVVDAMSAKLFWGNRSVATINDRGHVDVVKPRTKDDDSFLILQAFVVAASLDRTPIDKIPLGSSAKIPSPQPTTAVINTQWVNGTILTYCFLGDVSDVDANLVRRAFGSWKNIGIGVSFQEVVSSDEAILRIAFDGNDNEWSFVGTDALDVVSPEPTMNFHPPFDSDDALRNIGRALGLRHEHQNPHAPIRWNENAVLSQFSNIGWSEDQVRYNILRKGDPSDYPYGWDRASIMHFQFNTGLIDTPTRYRTEPIVPPPGLSAGDKKKIQLLYPKMDSRTT